MLCQPIRTAPPVARKNTPLGLSWEVPRRGLERGRFRSSPPSRGRMKGGRFEGAGWRDAASRAVAQGRRPGRTPADLRIQLEAGKAEKNLHDGV